MIYALSRYIIFLTFKNVIDSRLTLEHPQNGPGKLGLNKTTTFSAKSAFLIYLLWKRQYWWWLIYRSLTEMVWFWAGWVISESTAWRWLICLLNDLYCQCLDDSWMFLDKGIAFVYQYESVKVMNVCFSTVWGFGKLGKVYWPLFIPFHLIYFAPPPLQWFFPCPSFNTLPSVCITQDYYQILYRGCVAFKQKYQLGLSV